MDIGPPLIEIYCRRLNTLWCNLAILILQDCWRCWSVHWVSWGHWFIKKAEIQVSCVMNVVYGHFMYLCGLDRIVKLCFTHHSLHLDINFDCHNLLSNPSWLWATWLVEVTMGYLGSEEGHGLGKLIIISELHDLNCDSVDYVSQTC